jgi:ABC-type oligopeptide transport system ATPase subunit
MGQGGRPHEPVLLLLGVIVNFLLISLMYLGRLIEAALTEEALERPAHPNTETKSDSAA